MVLLGVIDPTAVYPYEPPEVIVELEAVQAAQAEQYLATVSAELRSSGAPPVSTRIAHGNAAEQICAGARADSGGVIAMASHGRGGLARMLLGSVATQTLQQSTVPVLVYRPVALRQTAIERAVAKVGANTFG